MQRVFTLLNYRPVPSLFYKYSLKFGNKNQVLIGFCWIRIRLIRIQPKLLKQIRIQGNDTNPDLQCCGAGPILTVSWLGKKILNTRVSKKCSFNKYVQ